MVRSNGWTYSPLVPLKLEIERSSQWQHFISVFIKPVLDENCGLCTNVNTVTHTWRPLLPWLWQDCESGIHVVSECQLLEYELPNYHLPIRQLPKMSTLKMSDKKKCEATGSLVISLPILMSTTLSKPWSPISDIWIKWPNQIIMFNRVSLMIMEFYFLEGVFRLLRPSICISTSAGS